MERKEAEERGKNKRGEGRQEEWKERGRGNWGRIEGERVG